MFWAASIEFVVQIQQPTLSVSRKENLTGKVVAWPIFMTKTARSGDAGVLQVSHMLTSGLYLLPSG